MIVVSDTTPLNYLILIESVHVLPALFGRVYAPLAVIEELSHPKTPEAVREWASNPPEWLTVQDPTHAGPTKLGRGEAAAIALAEELKADWVLMDERKGSREAQSRGLRVAGTLTILEEAWVKRLLDYEQTRDRLVSETTFHVTEEVLRQSEERYREQKLAQEQGRKQQEQQTHEPPKPEQTPAQEPPGPDLKHGHGFGRGM